MRTIIYIIQKEFLQIGRDKFMSRAILLMPILQMILLVYAATFEIKNVQLYVVDRDGTQASTELINKYAASTFFKLEKDALSNEEIDVVLEKGKADVVLVIPSGFEKDIVRKEEPKVQLLIDAVNGMAAELSLAYCRAIVMEYNQQVLMSEGLLNAPGVGMGFKFSSRYWYNPLLDYKIFMAPGILVVLITAIGWFMTGMNLVREKESGTIEQLNVTPIKKYQFIAGKLIPFLIIALVDLAFGLILAKLMFKVPFEGSLMVLFLFSVIYMLVILGIGLFISTISSTQQQVLFVSFFFVMIFILMSGLFTPMENMPRWGQIMNWFNPIAYYAKVIRMVLLKGSTLFDIRNDVFIMLAYAVVVNALAVWRYRKVA